MNYSRISRVNELIKESLAEILPREIDFPAGVFVTVTRVDTSADLRYAKVFVSVFPEKYFSRALKLLGKRVYSIQGVLNKNLHMKPLPRIEFLADRTESEAGKIEEFLKKIDQKKEESETQ